MDFKSIKFWHICTYFYTATTLKYRLCPTLPEDSFFFPFSPVICPKGSSPLNVHLHALVCPFRGLL